MEQTILTPPEQLFNQVFRPQQGPVTIPAETSQALVDLLKILARLSYWDWLALVCFALGALTLLCIFGPRKIKSAIKKVLDWFECLLTKSNKKDP